MAELMLGQPLFPGESGVDQLVEIIKVLGTPTKDQIKTMNPNYTEFKFPDIQTSDWSTVFRPETPQVGINLTSSVLRYEPTNRLTPLECCIHPFFDEIREEGKRLENGNELPPALFELSDAGELFEHFHIFFLLFFSFSLSKHSCSLACLLSLLCSFRKKKM